MKLIFDIIKSGREFPSKRNYHFNMTGGTIGRSEQCDWHLTDQQSFISNFHAKVEYRDKMYFITDTSTNGTFLKDPYKRLPKNIPIKINTTDIFVMGEYEIQARFLDHDYINNDLVSYTKQINTSNNNEPIQVAKQLIPNDDFLLDDTKVMNNSFIIEEDHFEDSNVMNLFTQEENHLEDLYDFEKEPFFMNNESNLETVTHNTEHEYIQMPSVKQKIETAPIKDDIYFSQQTHTSHSITTLDADYSLQNGTFEVLEKKLGINLSKLSKEQRDKKLEEIGQIVINCLEGLKSTLEANDKIKKDLLIEVNEKLNQNNPVKLGFYAMNILNEIGEADSIKLSEAIKKSFNEINIHNISLHRTSKNLINIALNKFSPKTLEHYFETNGQINNLMPKKYQMWDAYTNMFNKMQENPDFGVSMIAKEFSNEYNNVCYTIKLTSI